jgi:SAM-dependent methyltransferase
MNNSISKCILCRSSEKHLISEMNRYGIRAKNVTCKKCGLVYIDHNEDIRGLKEYYGDTYRRQYKVTDIYSRGYRDVKRAKAADLSKLLPKGIKRVLEIGCANGVLIKEVKEFIPGARLFGVEPDRDLAIQARQEYGIDVFCGMLEEYPFPDKKFDMIIMDHVLEHFKDPLACLAIVRKLLSARGVVYVEVPDVRAPYGDLEHNFLQSAHLFNFSFKTINILFKLAGFGISCSWKNEFMGFLIRKGDRLKRSDIDFSSDGEDYRLLSKYLRMYTNWFRADKSKSAQLVNVFLNKMRNEDTELETGIDRLQAASMKSYIHALMERDDHETTLKQIIAYFEKLNVSIADLLGLVMAGSILSKKLNYAPAAEIFEGAMHAVENTADQYRHRYDQRSALIQ